ncbi:hypothetical protein EV138_2902 [Kribbella voronezhensis]|uniref:4-amino-4-deoxy-L-arabinose transferase-like glycosyltransferase n=1 Tax=Kribbella voronezhensis TaxID=2512212 RepID=A0A4R7TD91_9ACTN|nr:hypothetical protein [Kribbella voronezhensis]TDU89338.1 hypothetical protein EV138_2902 [Kribbella voronezhensis]
MTNDTASSLATAEREVSRTVPSLLGLLPWRAVGAGAVKAAAGIALAWLTIWLMAGHSSSHDIVALLRFWVFGITLPGTLLWRLASPFRHNLIEDFAAGSLVGVSLLILVYLGVAPLGGQRWAWLWAAPVIILVTVVPSWRRRCLQRVERPVSPLTAWLVATTLALPLYAIGRYRVLAPAPYTDARSHVPDMAFHQALAASAKYDVPLQAPYVNGERMDYHYFWHQFTAATSWATGVDLTDLIYNIGWIPLLLAGCALIYALTDRIAPGSRWAGPLAIAVAGIAGTVDAYPAVRLPAESLISYYWGSPTQNLGGALITLLALIGVDLLRGRSGPATWVLFVVIAAAASGSKATVLPMIICGLGLVVFIRLLYGRFAKGALLIAIVLGGIFVAAIFVVFGNKSSGLAVRPWVTFAKVGLYPLVAKPVDGGGFDHAAMWIGGITLCLGLLLGSAGLLVLLGTAARWFRDPGMIFLVGIAIAGFGGLVLTDQPGTSQLYFHRTAVPIIAALAAAGAWMLVFWFADRRSGVLVFVSLLGGIGATAAARAIVKAHPGDGKPFRTPDGRLTGLIAPWVWTITFLLAVAILVTVLWKVAKRRGRPTRVATASFVLAGMGAGLFLPLQAMASYHRTDLPPLSDDFKLGPSATQTTAALWLRDHTAPGELIATNAHCTMKNTTGCDSRHFWIAALSERHVLVEGWGYTNTINELVADTGMSPNGLPFWDQQKLEDNDRAFITPTRDNLRLLKVKYGVRWLYADPAQTVVETAKLDTLATLRFKASDALIYELP